MRTWLITGANRGLGGHIAQAAIAAGDNVVVTGRTQAIISDAYRSHDTSRVLTVSLDVTATDQIQKAVDATIAKFGKIDILVNNAGYGQLGPFEDNSASDIESQFATNVFGLFAMCRAVPPVMRNQRQGHIFNIASIAGLAGMPGASVYCASKFAVVGFSESLAQEVKGFGVQVTLVAPGAFRTDFLDDSSARFGSAPLAEYKEFSSKVRSSSANNNHKQPGVPEKLGQALVELALNPEAPLHFIVGSDAISLAETRSASRKDELQRWRHLAVSTDA